MPAFRDLVAQEHQILGTTEQASCLTIGEPGASNEPRVVVARADQCGLAFSGGGIRSATFNLGVLQALAELDLLKHVDYLATVSGGGYIGGWWSAWRRRAGPEQNFPQGQDAEYELRHLREFSKYLAPRWRITDLDSWLFVATITAAMLPTLIATIGFVAIWALGFYVLAELAVFAPLLWVRAASIFVGTYLTLVVYDWLWRRRTCPELGSAGTGAFHALALLASGFVAGFSSLYPEPTVAANRLFDPLDELDWVLQPVSESEEGLSMLLRPTSAWLLAYGALALVRYGLTRAGSRIGSVTLR